MNPGCEERCPGCRYRDLSPSESDRRKTEWAQACLSPLGIPLEPLRAPVARLGYRRKVLLHARRASEAAVAGPPRVAGEAAVAGWDFGLLRRLPENRRVAELVPIPHCPLHAPGVNERFQVLRTLIPTQAPLAFAQISGTILTLVLKCAPEESHRAWARPLEQALRAVGVEGLQLNWNPAAGRRAFSSRHQEIIFGPRLIAEQGLVHGAMSFRQQIQALEDEVLDHAERFLALADPAVAIDLYSGTGASMRRWLERGWATAGVELVGEACEAAAQNAPGAPLFKGRVEQRLPQLDAFLANRDFVVFTNPPRDGHAAAALAWLEKRAPARIAYLSCNPRSLARDLGALAHRYELNHAAPFDFFPQTDHVECLALLTRRAAGRNT